jgi:tellurite resistance protein TerC
VILAFQPHHVFNEGPTAWAIFGGLIVFALALDLFVFHRRSHAMSLREALFGSAAWISLALLFNFGVYTFNGPKAGMEFLTGYLIELSLSVDNLFVFLLLFRYFAVPSAYQHKVLFWGIIGAVLMRLAFILAGVSLLERFHWAIYVFGGILIVSGLRMLRSDDTQIHPEKNPVLRLSRRLLPITNDYRGSAFLVKEAAKWSATPLMLVLIMVETTDLIFAVDSIPAVLAITNDPYIVFTSNIFAVLGLRALFFSLAGVMQLFHYLHYGLAAILVFVGLKMVLSDLFHLPTTLALGVVLGILVVCVVASLLFPAKKPSETELAARDVADAAAHPEDRS